MRAALLFVALAGACAVSAGVVNAVGMGRTMAAQPTPVVPSAGASPSAAAGGEQQAKVNETAAVGYIPHIRGGFCGLGCDLHDIHCQVSVHRCVEGACTRFACDTHLDSCDGEVEQCVANRHREACSNWCNVNMRTAGPKPCTGIEECLRFMRQQHECRQSPDCSGTIEVFPTIEVRKEFIRPRRNPHVTIVRNHNDYDESVQRVNPTGPPAAVVEAKKIEAAMDRVRNLLDTQLGISAVPPPPQKDDREGAAGANNGGGGGDDDDKEACSRAPEPVELVPQQMSCITLHGNKPAFVVANRPSDSFVVGRSSNLDDVRQQVCTARRCTRHPSSLTLLSNHATCEDQASGPFVYVSAFTFGVTNPGKLSLRSGGDWGEGGIIVLDGTVVYAGKPTQWKQGTWTAGAPGVAAAEGLAVERGQHTVELIGVSTCCDDGLSAQIKFVPDRCGGDDQWFDVSTAVLQGFSDNSVNPRMV